MLTRKGQQPILSGRLKNTTVEHVTQSFIPTYFPQQPSVGTGEDPGFNAQECTKKSLTTGPFGNTCEADEVSPEVEVGVVAGLRCLQP
jgi:hypothetical protein